MHLKIRPSCLVLLVMVATISTSSQQPPAEEFISILGRFGVMLPPKYLEYKPVLEFSVGGQKAMGSMYRWALDSDQVVISLPTAVRVYGSLNGQRAFREMRKFPDIVLAGNSPKDKDSVTKARAPEPRDFKIKYKHDPNGQLLEMHINPSDGPESESFVYRVKDNTIEHFTASFRDAKVKVVSTLDSNGYSREDVHSVPENAIPRTENVGGQKYTVYDTKYSTAKYRHEYELDDRGNWIKRKTFTLVKDEWVFEYGHYVKRRVPPDKEPSTITYRTIIYYQ